MESSYRRQTTTLIMLVIDTKRAATPNASGAKSLATIGATSTPSPWANTLPVTSFRTFPAKLEDGLDMEIMLGSGILSIIIHLKIRLISFKLFALMRTLLFYQKFREIILDKNSFFNLIIPLKFAAEIPYQSSAGCIGLLFRNSFDSF
jgi:hypothetical protein